jgi:hypothetical protein
MNQKILTIIFLTLLAVLGVLYFFYDKQLHQDDIKGFEAAISTSDSEDFQDFLYENKGKFVKLSVILAPEMVNNMLKGMDVDGRIVFTAIDGENQDQLIQYMIRLPDDGRRNFQFDKATGRLSGYFKTYRRVSVDGSPIINLVPISPTLLEKQIK